MNVRIVTDSTSDISQPEAQQLGIDVVPLRTMFGSEEYDDGVDITPSIFYEKLADCDKLPTTTQPSPRLFEKVFTNAQARGEKVVAILISGALSGTVQSANIAKKAVGGDITIVDSQNTTLSLRALVLEAVKMRDEGKSAKEISEAIHVMKSKVRLRGAVSTLENLRKGGRLSGVAALAGEILHIKPLLVLREGRVHITDKCHGHAKSYKMLLERVNTSETPDETMPVYLGYAGERDSAAAFEKLAENAFGDRLQDVTPIGAVIGTHIGAGAVAIAYFVQ